MDQENYSSLESSLMLFFTGFSRVAPLIAQKKIDNFRNKEEELNMLATLASSAASSLQDKNYDIKKIGELIHEAWLLKRELAEGVTTKEIDEIYKIEKINTFDDSQRIQILFELYNEMQNELIK